MKHILKRLLRRFAQSEIPPPVPYQPSSLDAERVKKIVLNFALTHNKGQEMIMLEKEFADYCHVPFALSTNSGTSALFLAVKSLGIGRGDEVIVPAYTFVASAQAVLLAGATPVFSDIDSTGTIHPKDIVKHISKRTKAIMPVHMFGSPADMEEILTIAKRHKLAVIEDCAQAVGARFGGKPVGSMGDVGCFSFNEKKAVPAGQGGMLVARDQTLYERAKAMRNTGIVEKNGIDVIEVGGTFFLTEMQAYLARAALRNLEYLNRKRRNNYFQFLSLLTPLRDSVTPLTIVPSSQPSFSRVILLLKTKQLAGRRDQIIKKLQSLGVPAQTFYPTPIPEYSLFKTRKTHTFKGAKFLCERQLGMEWSPYWQPSHIRSIADILIRTIL